MKSFDISFNFFITRFISYIFRLFIYASAILSLTTHSNIYSRLTYALLFVAHATIFITARLKAKNYGPLIRLLNDYSFITFILLGKEMNDFINFSLFILPLINSPNYTGKYNAYASLSLYIVAFASLTLITHNTIKLNQFIPLIIFFFINTLSKLREISNEQELNLTEPISEYHLLESYSRSKKKVLSDIISKFSKTSFLGIKIPQPDLILCFKVTKDRIALISSSTHIQYNKFTKEDYDRIKSSPASTVSEIGITIDRQTHDPNFILAIKLNGRSFDYLFVIRFNSTIILRAQFEKAFTPILNKIIPLLDIDNEIQQRKRRIRKLLRAKSSFIVNALTTVHFINNRLNPIKNFIKQSKGINKTLNPALKTRLDDALNKERIKASSSLDLIVDRCLKLERSNSPLSSEAPEIFSISSIIEVVRASLSHFFEQTNLNINENIIHDDEITYISTNIDQFEAVIDEIENNIDKHSPNGKEYTCTVNINKYDIIFYFSNAVKSKSIDQIKKHIEMFNEERLTSESTRSGLSIIIDNCKQLNIQATPTLQNSTFTMALKLSLNPNEIHSSL